MEQGGGGRNIASSESNEDMSIRLISSIVQSLDDVLVRIGPLYCSASESSGGDSSIYT